MSKKTQAKNIVEVKTALADKYTVIRSVHHEMASHNDGSIEMLTGKTPLRADPT